MAKLVVGINDLATLHPEIAAQANGWDPSRIHRNNKDSFSWKCSVGHIWDATVFSRTSKGDVCPYCSKPKIRNRVKIGINDLKTKFPEIAAEADGWDPSMIHGGNCDQMTWKCKKGHTWETTVETRTRQGTGCPFCSNQKCWTGFNDLRTLFPEIAKEADGWDPSTVLAGSADQFQWACTKCGHNWKCKVAGRTSPSTKSGCPKCAEYGFNPGLPAWFYLMTREDEQQIGITNDLTTRMRHHRRFGWVKIDVKGPHNGKEVLKIEDALKQWLKREIGLVPDKEENWYTANLKVHSLAELKERSGIETSIF